jgi:peptidoglycan/LPS O-acetylase OafA/YrhL
VLAFTIATFLSISTILFWGALPFKELAVVAPTFFAGMAGSQIVLQAQSRAIASPRWLPVALGVALVGSCYAPGMTGVTALLLALSGLVLSMAMLGGDVRAFVLPPLLRLGEVSYSLYMTHTLVQKFLYRALPVADFAGRSGGVRLGVLALYGMSIAALCAATYVLIERPCRRWVKGPSARSEHSESAPSLSASGSTG